MDLVCHAAAQLSRQTPYDVYMSPCAAGQLFCLYNIINQCTADREPPSIIEFIVWYAHNYMHMHKYIHGWSCVSRIGF